jgi:Protein of unknown function (DUF1302)
MKSGAITARCGKALIHSTWAFAGSLAVFSSAARSFDIPTGSDVQIRWDNTVKYSAAWRVHARDGFLLANPNQDDGDQAFARGLISNRLDILSEFDLKYHDFGFNASGAGWYDSVYNERNDNHSPQTFNPISVPYYDFPRHTRDINGRYGELLNAFVYGKESIGRTTLSVRAGRHTLLWGESLLIPNNGIAYGQAPLDIIKLLSVPNTLAKELFLPVTQVSAQLQLPHGFSIAGYSQFEYRKTRLPGVGSYFSFLDVADDGGERILAGPLSFYRGLDQKPKDTGQWGLALRYSSDRLGADFGLYALTYDDKLPQVGLLINPNFAIGQLGNYYLVYPHSAHIYGFSVSTSAGPANVAAEVSVRTNTPLVSQPVPVAALPTPSSPPGAVGQSFHAQVSALYLLHPTAFWQGGDFAGELAYNSRLSITHNPTSLDPTTTKNAAGLRFLFNPTWFQILPGADLTVPVGVGYNFWGNSSVVQLFNGGAVRGGDVTTGLNVVFRTVWRAGLTYTKYFEFGQHNPANYYVDRDFIALSVQRTF